MSDWLPSLNALRAFEATAKTLNFAHAAAELHVTPAAVKQLVRKLEATLGMSLIVRDGRGLRLTAAGAAGLDQLTAGFDHLSDAVRRIRAVDVRRRLVVSVEPSFAALWLLPRLESLRRCVPDVDVLIDSASSLVDLARGDADMAIRFGAQPDPTLVCERLFDEEIAVFCTPRMAEGLTGPADLSKCCFIHWETASLTWAVATRSAMDWQLWLRQMGVPDIVPQGGPRFSDYTLAVQAAVAGQGIVLGSAPVLADLVAAGLLARAVPQGLRHDVGYDAVTTQDAVKKAEVGAMLRWLTAEVRASGKDLT